MNITKGEDILTLVGTERKVGDKAPDFTLNNLEDEAISLSQLLTQPVLLSVVPDIDTRVCSIQTKRFNKEAAEIEGAALVTISKNTKEEQANWCAAEGVDMEMLHDTEFTFGRKYGVLIESLGLLARSVFVIDKDGTIVYREIVSELTDEPDYSAALAELKKIV